MCDPWVALGVSTLGSLAQANAASSRRSAQARAYDDYTGRQDALTREAQELFQQSLARQAPEEQIGVRDEATQAALDRTAAAMEQAEDYDPGLPGQEGANRVVAEEIGRSLSEELARARAQIGARARMQGYGDRTFSRGVEIGRTNDQLSNLGVFSRGSGNILDADLLAAQGAGGGMGLLGDLLVGGGQIGAAASGGGFFGDGGLFGGTTVGDPTVLASPASGGGLRLPSYGRAPAAPTRIGPGLGGLY